MHASDSAATPAGLERGAELATRVVTRVGRRFASYLRKLFFYSQVENNRLFTRTRNLPILSQKLSLKLTESAVFSR